MSWKRGGSNFRKKPSNPRRRCYKKTFGFHPLLAFIDHGQAGCGEPVAEALRPGNAVSNTAADHIDLIKQVLTQLPGGQPAAG
nr:hypothetical protein GCM10023233_07760 [Brevibacterium otitidis]